MEINVCKKCGLTLPIEDFIKSKGEYSNLCKPCNRILSKERYKKMMDNPEKKESRYEKKRVYGKNWYHTRKQDPEFNKMRLEWHKNERKKNPVYDMKCRVRSRTNTFLRLRGMYKNWKTKEMLGCDYQTLCNHLESLFLEGMSWDNRHLWDVDHIIELQTAETVEEVFKLGHYTNLQPLWHSDNIAKGGKNKKKKSIS